MSYRWQSYLNREDQHSRNKYKTCNFVHNVVPVFWKIFFQGKITMYQGI